MSLLIVPPKESITPRRKQKFYDFAVETFDYATELIEYKNSQEFLDSPVQEQNEVVKEILMLEELNEFQVIQIDSY